MTPTAPGNTTTATSHAAPTTAGNTTTARTRCGATTIATTITTGAKPTPGRPPCTTSRPYKGTETPQMATTPTTCSVFPWLNNNNKSTEVTDVAHVQSQNSTQDCGARDGVTQGGPVPEVAGDTTDIAQSQASTQECGARDRATGSDPVPEEAGCMTVRETAPPDNQPTDAIQSSAADQNAQRPDFPHDAGSEESRRLSRIGGHDV